MTVLPGLPELVLLLLIVFITFGMGKLGAIGDVIVRMRRGFSANRLGDESDDTPIDITPDSERADARPAYDEPRPGTRRPPVEDAELADDADPNETGASAS
jgi:Sec-independent protein translocase protein TatA